MIDITESIKNLLLDKTCNECNFMLKECVLHIKPQDGISCKDWTFTDDPNQTFIRMFDFSKLEEEINE